MMTANRKIFAVAVIGLSLVAAVVCSIIYLVDAMDDADRSVADTAITRALEERIDSKRPVGMKNNSAELASQLPRLLDAAMKQAEIDPENLDRISPEPARQAGQSEMTEIPLELNFRQISLRQLLTFVTSLTDENAWLTVRDLHLRYSTAPPSSAWNVEMTISYLTKSSGNSTALAN